MSLEGMFTALAFALCLAASYWFSALLVFYVAAVVAYFFAIIDHVGRGDTGMPGPSDAVQDWNEIIGQMLRGVLCFIAATLPLLIYFSATRELPSTSGKIGLIVLGQSYLPAAILASTLTNSTLVIMWPPAWIAVIKRAPTHYIKFTLLWFASVGVSICLVLATAPLIERLSNFGTGAFIVGSVWNFFIFVNAVLVGLFLRQHRDELDPAA